MTQFLFTEPLLLGTGMKENEVYGSVPFSSAPDLPQSQGGGAQWGMKHIPHLRDAHIPSLQLTPELLQPLGSVRSLPPVRLKEKHWEVPS